MASDNGENACPTQWESCRSQNGRCEVVAIGAQVYIQQGGRVVVSPNVLGEHRSYEEQTELYHEHEKQAHGAFVEPGHGCRRMTMAFARED
jgi:hypothetical protein